MASSGSFNTSGYDGRYLTFAWTLSSQSIENNTSTISWTLKGAGNAGSSWYNSGNFKVVINGTTVYSSSTRIKLYNGTLVSSGTFTIAHGSDGSKSFSASAQAGIYTVAVNCSGSGSWSLPTISRAASLTAAPNFTDEQSPTISYNNAAGNLVSSLQACISLTGSTDNIAYRDIPKTGSSYTFNLTTAERDILRNATPNSNTLNVIFYIRTIINGETYYSTLTRTMTIVNAAPTISGVSYEDTNATTTAITGDDQKIIQNNSTVSFTLASLAARKGATLTKVDININSVNVSTSLSGSSVTDKTISYGTINSSSNLNANITLTDSRGNTTTVSKPVIMLAWSLPTAIITCARKNNYYTETDITVNASYTSLGGENTITIQYQTKEQGSSSWSALQTLQDDVQATINLDNTKAWDIRVIVTDRLGSSTYTLSIDKGIPIVYFDRVKRSVGFNCFPSNEGSVEAGGLVLDDMIYIGSQTLLDEYTLSTPQTAKVLGSYNYSLIDGLFSGINIPSGYERAYRLTAQVSTNNENYASVGINNFQSNGVRTWSGRTMRGVCGSWYFKESDIVLEQTLNYTRNGTNLYLYNEGSTGEAYFYNVTVHGYLIKSSTVLPTSRAADEDISGGEPAS
jgi:hypothetical protein